MILAITLRARKPITGGKGAVQEVDDYLLSRFACYLIAQNGDPRIAEIAEAQKYFAIQTRRQELSDALAADLERLETRKQTSQEFKALSGAALPPERPPSLLPDPPPGRRPCRPVSPPLAAGPNGRDPRACHRHEAQGKEADRKCLRKTFCTHLAMQGVDLWQAVRLMRHRDPKLTVNVHTELGMIGAGTGTTERIGHV
jgi:hypothetical protein